ILVYMGLLYMQTFQPEELNQLIIRADIFEITELSKNEHSRQDKIKRLETIGNLEKQVLLNHTVFLGATAEMVEYALGPPKQVLFQENPVGNALYYVYFLVGDKRPTIFMFGCVGTPEQCKLHENYKQIFTLSKAYKKSTLDVDNMNVQE